MSGLFPGAGAQVYRNEAGEPIGWDYPDTDPPYDDNQDPYQQLDASDYCDCGEPHVDPLTGERCGCQDDRSGRWWNAGDAVLADALEEISELERRAL